MRNNVIIIFSIIILILIGCQNENKLPETKEQLVETPNLNLHAAIYVRDFDAIKQHIKAGSDLNVQEYTRKSTPLITAAALGEPEAAKLLIDAGANMNYKNSDSSTALQTAIVFGKSKVANILINSGADLNIKNLEGSTALHSAAFFCRLNIVKALLAKGADKSITNYDGKTALNIVETPFEDVKSIYDKIGEGFKPLGIEFDYEQIQRTRPIIAEMLK